MVQKIAVIRMKGNINISNEVRGVMALLNLHKRNWCVVVDKTPSIDGQVKKIKDFITYGDIDEATYKLLIEKKAEKYTARETDTKGKITYNYQVIDKKKYKKYFRLNPPRGGFEKKGTKRGFGEGGALGYRGEKINDLIKKMI
jgi:large subunit ribosomal protein L30